MRMRWGGYVACMGVISVLEFWLETLNARDYLEDKGIRRWLILKWIFKK
jgi:hypothetical protein